MSENQSNIGKILWQDLTVENASQIKDFYTEVVGWKSEAVSMGNYDDYSVLTPADDKTIGGICHATGVNKNIPAQWLLYVQVASVEKSIETCVSLGGKVLDGPRLMSGHQFCVIQDPAGAVMALMSPEDE